MLLLDKASDITTIEKIEAIIQEYVYFLFKGCLQGSLEVHMIWCIPAYFITTLQLLRFVDEDYLGFNFQNYPVKLVVNIGTYQSRFSYDHSVMQSWAISLSILCGFVFLLVFASLVKNNRVNDVQTSVMLLLSTVLFTPVLEGFSSIVRFCGSDPVGVDLDTGHPILSNKYMFECYDAGHISFQTVSFVLASVFIGIILLIDNHLYQSVVPFKLNESDNSIAMYSTVQSRIFHMGQFLVVVAIQIHPSVMKIVLAVWAAAQISVMIYYLPYTCDWTQYAMTFRSSLLCLVAVFACLNFYEGTEIIVSMMVPIAAIQSVLIVEWRYSYALACMHQNQSSETVIQLHSRALIRRFKQNQYNGGDIYIDNTPDIVRAVNNTMKEVEMILDAGVNRFPNSMLLRTFLVLLYIDILSNRPMAYEHIRYVELSEDAKICYRLQIDCAKTRLELTRKIIQSSEVQLYLEFKRAKTEAENASMQSARVLISFWTELQSFQPDIDKMIDLGKRYKVEVNHAKENYTKQLRQNPYCAPVLRAFAALMLDLEGKVKLAESLFAAAAASDEDKQRKLQNTIQSANFQQRIDQDLDIFDERNAVLGITVQSSRLGLIESANAAASTLFGYEPGELANKNISTLIPSPISDMHNELVRGYLQRGTSRIVNYTRMVFAQHSNGYLIPIHLYVRWAVEAHSQQLGVIQALPQNPEEVHLMVDAEKNCITYVTASAKRCLGIFSTSLKARPIPLCKQLPILGDTEQISEVWGGISTSSGITTSAIHQLTLQPVTCVVRGVKVHVNNAMIAFLRIDFSTLDNAERSVSDDDDLLNHTDVWIRKAIAENQDAPLIQEHDSYAEPTEWRSGLDRKEERHSYLRQHVKFASVIQNASKVIHEKRQGATGSGRGETGRDLVVKTGIPPTMKRQHNAVKIAKSELGREKSILQWLTRGITLFLVLILVVCTVFTSHTTSTIVSVYKQMELTHARMIHAADSLYSARSVMLKGYFPGFAPLMARRYTLPKNNQGFATVDGNALSVEIAAHAKRNQNILQAKNRQLWKQSDDRQKGLFGRALNSVFYTLSAKSLSGGGTDFMLQSAFDSMDAWIVCMQLLVDGTSHFINEFSALSNGQRLLEEAVGLMTPALIDRMDEAVKTLRLLTIGLLLLVFLPSIPLLLFVMKARLVSIRKPQGEVQNAQLSLPRTARMALRKRAKTVLESIQAFSSENQAVTQMLDDDESDEAIMASALLNEDSRMQLHDTDTEVNTIPRNISHQRTSMGLPHKNSDLLSSFQSVPSLMRRNSAEWARMKRGHDNMVKSAMASHKQNERKGIFAKLQLYAGLILLVMVMIGVGLALACSIEEQGTLAASRIVNSPGRISRAIIAAYFAREHQFRDYAAAVAFQPLDPTVVRGEFKSSIMENTHISLEIQRGIAYGQGIPGLSPPANSMHDKLMFQSNCELAKELTMFNIHYNKIAWEHCQKPLQSDTAHITTTTELSSSVDSRGELRNGQDAAQHSVQSNQETIGTLPSGQFQHQLFTTAIQPHEVEVLSLWKSTETLLLDYLQPVAFYSAHSMRQNEREHMYTTQTFIVILLSSTILVILIAHILVLERIPIREVARVQDCYNLFSIQTGDVIKAAPGVQIWAQDTLRGTKTVSIPE